ncbi:MAG: N-acetyl-gamma-glutamyl-phosphate reductase [Planctomycetes bacterium]|nr:N-acetyl-gamma-glutamyl-phosphate reductase [Planctomycetota bacterium]
MVRVAIIGASGYTGADSIEIILRHPEAEVTYLTALPEECGHLSQLFGQFKGRMDLDVVPLDLDVLASKADVVLCCLPHRVSMGFVPKLLAAGCKVVDFSADYRIKDVAVYEKYYQEHTDQANLKTAVYGLPELYRAQIKDADLVANPGCFPTTAALACAPVLAKGLVKTETVIVNSVTGVSGGGKNPNVLFHFPNMNENLFAYGMGVHRHMPEIEQVVSDVAGAPVNVIFQPHAGPFDRGILSTIYLEPKEDLSIKDLMALYQDYYEDERFVQICETSPHLKNVSRTNYCHIFPTVVKNRVVIFSAIDNLVKGASGQAIQNMNILFGLDESLGLL